MFGLDPLNEQNLLDDATRRGHQNNPDPGLFDGLWSAPFSGAAEGAYKAASLFNRGIAAPVAKTLVGPVDSMMGFPVANWIDDQNNKRAAMLDLVKPDPRTTGALAKGVHGIFTQAPLMAGLVATGGLAGLAALPGWAAGIEGESAFQQGLHDKLDPGTSFGMGAITALSTWAGMKVPMHTGAYLPAFTGATGITIKEGILPSLVAGAAANVPVGMITRGATGDWLRYNGFPEMADNFKTFDQEAIVSDLVMGAGFGALGHYGPLAYDRYQKWRKGSTFLDSDKDAAFTINNNHSLERGPAIPTDPATRAANYEAKLGALRAAIEGKSFIVGDGITNGNWINDPSAVHINLLGTIQLLEHMKGTGFENGDHSWLVREGDERGIDTSPLTGGGEYQGPRGETGAQTSKSANQIAWEASPEHADAVKFLTEKWTGEGMPPEEAARLARETIDKAAPPPKGLNIPGAVAGHISQISVNGVYHQTQMVLVDAAQHQATLDKGENQFRNRRSPASEAQVEKIANRPDIHQLLDAPLMDYGAPTMDRNGNIIGGNGRFEGLSRAYDRGNGGDYLGPLKERLAAFGIDPAAADGMKKPVLVRAFVNDIDIKKTAILSNAGAGLRMSELELARQDAASLGDIRGLALNDNGSISTFANKARIMSWMADMPDTEINTLIDSKTGALSVEGERRFQHAILYEAFGDSDTLKRLIESRDPEVRNVALALVRSGPKIAEAKASIAAGEMYPFDITPDLTAAVEKLAELRANGTKLAEYMLQNEMFAANQLSPDGRKILVFLAENNRSVKAMSEMVNSFYDQARAAGNPNAVNFLDGPPPTQAQILDQAIAATGKRVKNGELIESATAADQKPAVEVAAPAEQQVAAEPAPPPLPREDSAENPVKPGEEFMVVRSGSEEGLRFKNAGTPEGVADFLAKGDDFFSSVVASLGEKIFVYAAKVDNPFGDYGTFNAERSAAGTNLAGEIVGVHSTDTVGRNANKGVVWYSFPESGYEARLLYEIPMTEVRARVKELGYQDFDDTGSKLGGEIIRDMIAEKQNPKEAPQQPAPDLSQLSPVERLQYRVDNDFTALLQEYAKLPDSMGGKVISGDIAKELSPEYNKDRTIAAEIHEAASNFAKALYRHILDQPVPEGQKPVVVITGGGTGSGKSTALKLAPELIQEANAVYDTTMSDYKSSENKVQQALNSGREVVIRYLYRDPVDAFVNGNLSRARRMEEKEGSGRVVPIEVHAASHVGARETVQRLADNYADDGRVVIQPIDNTRGKGNATFVPLDSLPKPDTKNLEGDLYAALEKEYRNGNVSRDIYEATAGKSGDSQGIRGQDGPGIPGQPESRRTAGSGTPYQSQELAHLNDPVVGEALKDRPSEPIPVADGQVMPAEAALLNATHNVEKSGNDAKAFEAAITCLLRG